MKAKLCPFCGAAPTVTPYPNNKGASVECPSIDCCTFGHKYDLDEWNHRAPDIMPLVKYLFEPVIIYSTKLSTHNVMECRHCKGQGVTFRKVHHSKDCPVGELIASR